MTHPSLTVPQPILDRIDALIQDSGSLQACLKAAGEQWPGLSRSDVVQRFRSALEKGTPARDWVSDPSLASLLPVLIRYHQPPTDDVSRAEFSLMLEGLIGKKPSASAWLRSISYPFVLVIAVLIVTGVLLGVAVPVYSSMFDEFALRTPTSTRMLIFLSNSMLMHPVGLLFAVLGSIALACAVVLGGRWLLDRFQWIASIGTWSMGSRGNLSAMARWVSTLAELLNFDVPLGPAIAVAGVASRKPFYRDQSQRIATWMESHSGGLTGESIARAFSPVAISALYGTADGKPSVSALRGIAGMYWERLQGRGQRDFSWVVPVSVVIIGGFVAFVVVALLMPMVSLITSLSG